MPDAVDARSQYYVDTVLEARTRLRRPVQAAAAPDRQQTGRSMLL